MTLPLSQRASSLRIRTGSVRAVHVGLALYGIVLALIGAAYLDSKLPLSQMVLQGSRQNLVANSIAVLDQGGPLLLGTTVPYREGLKNPQANFFEVNQTDDPGIYIVLPLLGKWTGTTDSLLLLKWFFIGSMAFLLVLLPLLFYAAFDSVASAIAAPLIVLFKFTFLWNTDIYWVPAWAALLGMPAVFAVAGRPWRRWISLPALAAVAALGSYATAIRSGGGIPLALAALVVAVWRERGVAWRIAAAAIVVVGYLSINTFGLYGIRQYRDSVSHMVVDPQHGSGAHPFWHPAYLGLGYLPNPWGIRWNDSVAFAAAAKVDPKVVYLSPEYERILRHLYFKDVRSDPGLAADVYLTKAAVTFHDAIKHFWLALIGLPFAIVVGRRRRTIRVFLLLCVPVLLVTLAPPVMTIPPGYETGWLGAVGLVALIVLAWALTAVGEALGPQRPQSWSGLLDGVPAVVVARRLKAAARARLELAPSLARPLALAVAGVLLTAGVAAAAIAKERSKADVIMYQRESTDPAPPQPARLTIRSWQLASGLPDGWTPSVGTALTPGATGLSVTTNTNPTDYQIVSEPLHLKAGGYVVQVDGRPLTGGFILDVLVTDVGQFVSQANFWYGEAGYDHGRPSVAFSMPAAHTVQIILSNWQRTPRASTWVLRSIALQHQFNG